VLVLCCSAWLRLFDSVAVCRTAAPLHVFPFLLSPVLLPLVFALAPSSLLAGHSGVLHFFFCRGSSRMDNCVAHQGTRALCGALCARSGVQCGSAHTALLDA
jgi:hypothetical protein